MEYIPIIIRRKDKFKFSNFRFQYKRKGINIDIYINQSIPSPLHTYICNRSNHIYFLILTFILTLDFYPCLLTVIGFYSLFYTKLITVLDPVYINVFVFGSKPKSYRRYLVYNNVPKTNASLS